MKEITETAPEFRAYSQFGGPMLHQVRTAGPGHPYTETVCADCAREAYEDKADDPRITFYGGVCYRDDTEHECENCGSVINSQAYWD